VGVDDDHSWQFDCENIIRDVLTEVVPTMPMAFHKPQASSLPTQGNGLAKLPYNPSYQASPLEPINKNTQSASTMVTTTSMAVGGISAVGEKPAKTPCGLLVGTRSSQQNNADLWHTNTFADCRSSSDPKKVSSIREPHAPTVKPRR